ncbi:hypothetical protein [Diaphorobacter caeni]|uniref:hypothetical protein n=1 Tax=Diaphorobacter caeni TaxID=2784387 RepID=UPI0018905B7D|nr:hypothetical protein [Diaphorobacter caeni]MBF5006037.1 hypothetical protein [Diaphorobacter caeni]
MNIDFFTPFSLVSTKLFSSGATRRLLQSGRCFAALVNCRFMHHGRRFHCATPATVVHFLSGLPQAKLHYRRGVASSEQLPSREPCRLFDEMHVAPDFSFSFSSSSFVFAARSLAASGGWSCGGDKTAPDTLLRGLAVPEYCLRPRRRVSGAVLSLWRSVRSLASLRRPAGEVRIHSFALVGGVA